MQAPSGSGDPHPKRRRPPDDAGADLISALPDELLVLILERVEDSRAAVCTSALSRRWRRLDPAHWHPAFDLSVAAHLLPEYAGTLDLYRDARAQAVGRHDHGAAAQKQRALAERLGRCEDRAMEAYVRGLACFVRSPQRCPRARSLRLEFFVAAPPPEDDDGVAAVAGGGNRKGMAACLASAVRWPVVEHLAVEAVPRAAAGGKRKQRPHVLPEAVLAGGPAAPALATLHVKNCLLSPSGHGYGAVQAHPRGHAARRAPIPEQLLQQPHAGVLTARVPRLQSCNLERNGKRELFKVDLPPASRLQELIMETCNCGEVKLVNAPSLERCSSLCSVRVHSAPRLETLVCHGTVPRLDGSNTTSLRFVELSVWDPSLGEPRLASFFRGIPKS